MASGRNSNRSPRTEQSVPAGRDAILYGPDMLGRLLDTFVAAPVSTLWS